MKLSSAIVCSFLAVLVFSTAQAALIKPALDLEKKIAYQQGHFGALYARCGTSDEKAVIGGSLVSWRMETFRGYNGSPQERAAVEKAFDEAAGTIMADQSACDGWIKQAAVTWHDIIDLAQYGTTTVANP